MTSSSASSLDNPNRRLTVADSEGRGMRHVSVGDGKYTILVSHRDGGPRALPLGARGTGGSRSVCDGRLRHRPPPKHLWPQ